MPRSWIYFTVWNLVMFSRTLKRLELVNVLEGEKEGDEAGKLAGVR